MNRAGRHAFSCLVPCRCGLSPPRVSPNSIRRATHESARARDPSSEVQDFSRKAGSLALERGIRRRRRVRRLYLHRRASVHARRAAHAHRHRLAAGRPNRAFAKPRAAEFPLLRRMPRVRPATPGSVIARIPSRVTSVSFSQRCARLCLLCGLTVQPPERQCRHEGCPGSRALDARRGGQGPPAQTSPTRAASRVSA